MKFDRQKLIVELVRSMEIRSQNQLAELLAQRGMTVTQATLSRDMTELSLIKTELPGGGTKYTVPRLSMDSLAEADRAAYDIILSSVVGSDFAGNTAVIKCRTGMAQAVCAKLDEMDIENAVGTIAGDDTIFMLMRTEPDARRLAREISSLITRK